MPGRSLPLEFYIDTNRINARGNLCYMNQLEKWHKDGVISIQMPEAAHYEALAGNNPERASKAKEYICSIVSPEMQTQYRSVYNRIKEILVPSGTPTRSQENDVRIVSNAAFYMSILVTNDGDSSCQPNGILGNRENLTELVRVMRDSEAVELVREAIKKRDKRARWVARVTGQSIPEWVGSD